jgi:hypothetical protein
LNQLNSVTHFSAAAAPDLFHTATVLTAIT